MVWISCQGMKPSNYKSIGAKLKVCEYFVYNLLREFIIPQTKVQSTILVREVLIFMSGPFITVN